MIWDLIANMPITRVVVAHRQALVYKAGKVYRMQDRRLTETRLAMPKRLGAVGVA